MKKMVSLLAAAILGCLPAIVCADASSYSDIKKTYSEFETFVTGLEGKSVKWSGTVLESNPRLLGGQYLVVDLDGDKKEDVHLLFDTAREKEAQAFKGGEGLTFEGKISSYPTVVGAKMLLKLDNPTLTTDGSSSRASTASAEKPSVLIDIPKLSGLSKKKVAEILGEPTDCEDTKYGPKCAYSLRKTEIVYIDGKSDWITVNETSDLSFAPESITKLGFESAAPTFATSDAIRWEGLNGLREVLLTAGGGGSVFYAYIKSVTK